MNDINLPPFYVGQRVVALRTFVGLIVKGKEYTIAELGYCAIHNAWHVTVYELPSITNIGLDCTYCSNIVIPNNKFKGCTAKNFAPIEENFQSISLEKILEEETKLISVN